MQAPNRDEVREVGTTGETDARGPFARAQAFPILILLLTLLTVPFLIFGDRGLERVDRLEAELEQIRRDNGKLEARCRELRRRLEAYRTRPGYLEDVARDELGLVRPDELVLVFSDDK